MRTAAALDRLVAECRSAVVADMRPVADMMINLTGVSARRRGPGSAAAVAVAAPEVAAANLAQESEEIDLVAYCVIVYDDSGCDGSKNAHGYRTPTILDMREIFHSHGV